jgi:RNA polymerase sigma-70 factor, ECF subfamily
LDEQEAIRRCQGGDHEAFRFLVEAHQDKAFRIACLIIGDSGIAEDATQEAFLSAWRSIHTFNCGHAFAPWFNRIVVRSAVRLLQKKGITLTSLEEMPSLDPEDTRSGPECSLITAEQAATVRAAVGRLSAQRRLIITLYYHVELTTSEIAGCLGIPEGTVKSEIFRAKKELRPMLQEVADDEVE